MRRLRARGSAAGGALAPAANDTSFSDMTELIGTTMHRIVADDDGWLIRESRWTEEVSEVAG